MKRSIAMLGLGLMAGLGWFAPPATAQETFKIAYIDPASGPFANVGDAGKHHFEYFAEQINAKGGILGKPIQLLFYDSQVNSKVSVEKLKQAIDEGAVIVAQGNSSGVANAITDAVLRHNTRNPGKEVLFFNYAAVDPALTNDKCNFWHFRFDAHADIKMKALVKALVQTGRMHKVYVLGQNYSFGQAVAGAAEREISAQAPGVEVVGNELHPIGKVKDFAPYINKIRASGADTLITGNWGNDMSLLIKAASDAGLKTLNATYYADGLGAATAMGNAALGTLNISEGNLNDAPDADKRMYREFKARYKIDYYYYRVQNMFDYLVAAANKAQSLKPIPLARALEGLEVKTSRGRSFIRADDHQLFMPMYVSEFAKGVEFDLEDTGFGWKTVRRIETEDTLTPTSCQMERPS